MSVQPFMAQSISLSLFYCLNDLDNVEGDIKHQIIISLMPGFIAQLVAHLIVDPRVASLNPSAATKLSRRLTLM